MTPASAVLAGNTVGEDEIALSAGRMNMRHPDEGPWDAGVEYRWAPLGSWKLVPVLGLTIAEEGAGYAYAAIRYDFHLGRSWTLAPEFGAGAFRNGGNLDLGYALEFKSALEISYRVADRCRVGLVGYHLSNASLSEDNPGTEVVELVIAVPIGRK
jgi:hypothetical protein